MRKRILFAVLGASAAIGLVTGGTASAGGVASADSTDTAAAGTRVIDVTSTSQIPTVKDGLGDQAGLRAIYRLTMTNNEGGQCLDGDADTIGTNGTKVQLWGCHGGTNQTWLWAPAAGQPVGYYTIQNSRGNQCLDGDLNTIPANGAKVQLWACNGWTNQTWLWHGATLTNLEGGQCLDGDLTQIPANGAKVQLWACNGWSNQNWTTHSQ
ncbi:RICIN domain-containing protein [Streptomyces sp. NBC_01275]|uniref:RICIN domain-containing protein n=1 Tax=Streptomyces sp. NBC_01275 TaxID=2903807 RepID=UPI002255F66B|nr:RICIN domain-containing protein [Streptomyces sp. NBC_01275]MCX4759409.1 RICIN domain-containing protein [Streptomyces sp. NBC_01275]